MKFGMRSAVDVVFKTTRAYAGEDTLLGQEWGKGEPVLYFDSLKMATVEGTAETVYAQGGKGNPRLIAWEGDKTVTFTFEDALISVEGMSILAGADLIKASAENEIRVHKKAVVQAGTDGAVSVGAHIAEGETVVKDEAFGFVVNADGKITKKLGSGTIVTGGQVTFTTAPIEGNSILVDFYVTKESGVQEINITPDQFAGYFYIEGDTLFRRQSDGKDLAAQIIIPNAKIQTAFTFEMSPSGDPSTFTFTADAFPGVLAGDPVGAKRKMYAMRILED